jgi:hypothetical protein
MRRRERMVATLGAVLVVAAVCGVTAVLVVHGSRAVARPQHPDVVPADLTMAAFDSCMPPWNGEGGFAISMDTTGHVEFSALGGGADPEAADAYTAAINSCMTGFTFESAPFAYRDVVSSSVDRLIAYDYAWRWMLPCLAGHDRLPSRIPSFSDFAKPEGAPWSNYYSPTSRDDFDELLEVRYACGPGTGPLQPHGEFSTR